MADQEDRTCGNFIRLDRADEELATKDDIKVYAIAAEVASGEAERILLCPIEKLRELGVDDSWHVTLNRVNAQLCIPSGSGPHHLTCIWTIIEERQEAHGVAYRVPPPSS